MNKIELRKEFFKLKNKSFSYAQCRRILKAQFEVELSVRTLKRWNKKLDLGGWNLCDKSKKPHHIHKKVNNNIEQEVLALRGKTGWGSEKIIQHLPHLNVSDRTIDKIFGKYNLLRQSKTKGRQKKWIRWQRKHPNSLWQIDHTDEQNLFDCYTISVLDDCSRYSVALVKAQNVTTDVVTQILDELIKKNGKPQQVLTDNGSAYGSKSQHSRFDRWCKRRGIKHIRTKIHSPTTNGKVERLFKTMDEELKYCNNDLELFRMRYNHFRPHSSLNNKTPADIYFNFMLL